KLKDYLQQKNESLEKKLGHLTLSLLSEINSSMVQNSPTSLGFSLGTWPQKNSHTPPPSHNTLSLFPSSPWHTKMRVRRHEAEIHLLFQEKQRQSQEKGIILHELLARVFKEEDIEYVVTQYANTLPGTLPEVSQNEVKAMLREIWQIFVENGWTTGFSIHNEETLLTPIGLIRPDKVFLANDKSRAIVVDYKSGLQSREEDTSAIVSRYKEQLTHYCEAIKKMGYTKVEGYVLLISSQKLVKVGA
ncbi:MAG: PD-(D/E)XK nuclease family protein, partial [Brevinematales bacterium]|nr:PD-(D/E)XK nuclease family protein [Brevinematales bacterium]